MLGQAESINQFRILYQQCVESDKNVNRAEMLLHSDAAVTNIGRGTVSLINQGYQETGRRSYY